ncbi:hypothetical protein M0R72_01640 [Candidatus Pacearchaeota archaeon]|jgi:hypothetical protein|nr:hypothetical protein [Candidatus Pacearchaeota archaeon]
MSAEFIVKYIAEAASKDENPADAAKAEIKTIDETLNIAEKLKIRRMQLVSVLDHLGDDTYKRRRANSTPSSDDIDVSSEDNQELLQKIRTAISEFGPMLVRDLIREVGGYDQDSLIMRAVKWLGEQEIVSRDSEGRVQPGKFWEKDI